MEIPGNEFRIKNKLVQDKGRVNEKSAAKTSDSGSGTSAASGKSGSEQIALSPKARDIQKASEIAKAAPDVRVDKVERIKKQLADGTYHVETKDLSDKILRNIINDSNFLG